MPDPSSLPPATILGSSATAQSRRGFLPGLIRYLAAASLLQLGFFAIVRAALFFQVRDYWVLGLFGLASPVLSLALASVFFRRFTNTRWAIASLLVATSACAYLLVRFAYGFVAWQYYSTLVEPVLRPLQFVDLTKGGRLPASFPACKPLDTTQIDEDPTSPRDTKRLLADKFKIQCTVNMEEAIRACARFNKVDLGSKSEAELLICAGTLVSVTVPRSDTIYLDSNRVILYAFRVKNGLTVFEEYRGDTRTGYLPDSIVVRYLHKRDSLRLWGEDSARASRP